ncbi:hypothetical protein Aph02nite_24790 [Actinoplanes philippinensis]|uniref:Uncharacterized protein n=1 Tax=Actinoplanes philippinensis TaxID=35752 RepID=A0A1I2G2S6_9ACTN|nr:hypothetical protein [Actinoplanes philippinensis]GIE76529.1 hypothetical protein Aph02nite_24790 [Actinoplanes philippinensis]SFF11413.1 hypothetical protein SAMN05421541_106138 [Actinoplanes philippinensis]
MINGDLSGAADAQASTPDTTLRPGLPAGRTLRIITVAVGVAIAVYVSFWMPVGYVPTDVSPIDPEGQSVVQRFGPFFALLSLLPALVAAIPMTFPARAQGWAGAGSAAVLTVFAVSAGNLGLYYFPVAMLLWAATIVPLVLDRGIGRSAALVWRLVAAAFLVLPALPAGSAIFSDDSGIVWIAVVLWVVAPIALAALCVWGMRVGYALTAFAGAAVMVAAVVEQGFLFAAFWLVAAVYLLIGASGFTVTRTVSVARLRPRF